jgi:hypothetical protein
VLQRGRGAVAAEDLKAGYDSFNDFIELQRGRGAVAAEDTDAAGNLKPSKNLQRGRGAVAAEDESDLAQAATAVKLQRGRGAVAAEDGRHRGCGGTVGLVASTRPRREYRGRRTATP